MSLLRTTPDRLVKTLLYKTDQGTIIAVLIRGDHQANEIKIKRQLGVHELVLANPESVQAVTSAPVGFVGPVGLTRYEYLPITVSGDFAM